MSQGFTREPFGSNAAAQGKVIVTVDFGATATHDASTVVTGQTWVSTDSVIVASAFSTTTDHPDAVEALLEQIDYSVSALVAGDGFTLKAHAPNRTTGQYKVACVGA